MFRLRSKRSMPPLFERNPHFVAFDRDLELLDFGKSVDRRNAGSDAKSPAVPGALHSAVGAIDVAFAERPAAMRAGVVKREVFAVHIEQGDSAALDFDDLALARQ